MPSQEEAESEARLGRAVSHPLHTRESKLEVDGTLSVLLKAGNSGPVRHVRVFPTQPPEAICDCLDFEEHGVVCKHIWFVLLTSYKVRPLLLVAQWTFAGLH